jgi:hypothetical protein
MARLDVERSLPAATVAAAARPDLTLRTPVNWTAVIFFGLLAALHLFMAATAFYHARWDGYLSFMFGIAFTLVTIACALIGTELTVLADQRSLRLRTGTRRIYFERCVPFAHVRSVRLTLLNARRPRSSTIELVCDHEVIDCPPTTIPREEALCLAMTLGVRLVKVFGDAYGPVSDRIGMLPPDCEIEPPNDSKPSSASED